MLAYSAIPQVLLLAFLAGWLGRVIRRDLEPLAQLQAAVDLRDASDLAPVPTALTEGSTTREVERLGTALNSMLSRLARSIEAQREFAGNVPTCELPRHVTLVGESPGDYAHCSTSQR